MSSAKNPGPALTGKRARTRAKLLDVAAELFLAQGIAGVSLDAVARQAGLTKGAIYGNFANKDELVFAVATERARRFHVAFESAPSVREQLHAMVQTAFGQGVQGRTDYAFFAELDLYSFSREELAWRMVELARKRHARSARNLAGMSDQILLPPEQFAIAVQGIFSGLLFQHACHPGTVTEETARVVLESLLRPGSE